MSRLQKPSTLVHMKDSGGLGQPALFEAELWAKECHITALNVKATSRPFMPQLNSILHEHENAPSNLT